MYIKKLLLSVRFHNAVVATVMIPALFLALVLNDGIDIPLLLLVFMFGMAGGIVNTFVRLSSIPSSEDEFSEGHTRVLAIIQVYVSPVVGGVFAVVLYAFFITGIITGAFFPEFKGLNEPYSGVADLFGNLSPDNRLDAAKALVWAFVAGFVERLVPNILDKVASGGEHTVKGKSDHP